MASPFLAAVGVFAADRALGQSRAAASSRISIFRESDTLALRLAARRTWGFFEKFVTAEENHLPPDNFQEDPRARSRTALRLPISASISMSCWRRAISAGSARWKPSSGWKQRWQRSRRWSAIAAIFSTGTIPEIWRSLEPRYVSTVDSGNLAGNLLVVKRACEQLVAPADAGRDRARADRHAVRMMRDSAAAREARAARRHDKLQALMQLKASWTASTCTGPSRECLSTDWNSRLWP